MPSPKGRITADDAARLFEAAGCDAIDVINMSPGQTTHAAWPQGRQLDRPQPYLSGRDQFHREIFKHKNAFTLAGKAQAAIKYIAN